MAEQSRMLMKIRKSYVYHNCRIRNLCKCPVSIHGHCHVLPWLTEFSGVVLFVSRFLAIPILRKYLPHNRKIRQHHCSKLLFIQCQGLKKKIANTTSFFEIHPHRFQMLSEKKKKYLMKILREEAPQLKAGNGVDCGKRQPCF